MMKISREKYIRSGFVDGALNRIASLMVRSVSGEFDLVNKKRKSYRNVCHVTGRARGVVRSHHLSRFVFRKLADNGELEGVRRASW